MAKAKGETVLEASKLVKTYRDAGGPVEVLRELDLEVNAGEFTVILGPSGTGKSTLLNLIGLMDRPNSGDLKLFGRSVIRLSDDQRARMRNRRLGFVFQFDSLLPEFTVLENVMMPGRIDMRRSGRTLRGVEAHARELLEAAGIAKLADRFPVQLSGGERQRAATARALMNKPAILLADEPTGNLDRRNGELVSMMLRDLAADMQVAVLMVTHNENVAQLAARALHLADGRLREEAP